MKKFTTVAAVALSVLGLAGCATEATTARPIKQASAVEETATTLAEAPSSCDVVREALLTGTPADIEQAMAALKADRSADGTAREYADYYLARDAGDPDMREMDVTLVRMSCGL